MSRTLVVKPPQTEVPAVLERVPQVAARTESVYVVTNGGRHLDLSIADREPAHLYATGSAAFGDVVVAREFALLYDNAFTAAWLPS